MKCAVCGSKLKPTRTDLPFKLRARAIVILKDLPVLQCEGCSEYFLEDEVLARVDQMLARVDSEAQLEIVRYAA